MTEIQKNSHTPGNFKQTVGFVDACAKSVPNHDKFR